MRVRIAIDVSTCFGRFFSMFLILCCWVLGCQCDESTPAGKAAGSDKKASAASTRREVSAVRITKDYNMIPYPMDEKKKASQKTSRDREIPTYKIKVPPVWKCQKLVPDDIRFQRCYDPTTRDEFNIMPINLPGNTTPELMVNWVVESDKQKWEGYELISKQWTHKSSKKYAQTFEHWFRVEKKFKTIAERILFQKGGDAALHLGVYLTGNDKAQVKTARSIVASFSAPAVADSKK